VNGIEQSLDLGDLEKLTKVLGLSLQSKIVNYMRQMAVITPYAEFVFRFIGLTPE
jgi:hypothetical protein